MWLKFWSSLISNKIEHFETGSKGYLYFFKSYFSANATLSSPGRDVMYFFHPGHQPMCHFHMRPKNDFGLLSYFALKLQSLQSSAAIGKPPYLLIYLYMFAEPDKSSINVSPASFMVFISLRLFCIFRIAGEIKNTNIDFFIMPANTRRWHSIFCPSGKYQDFE